MHATRLEMTGDGVRYTLDGSTIWELPISALRAIGEATNQNGPYLDDFFFCFVMGPTTWYEASFYAEGREEFLILLESTLQCELRLRLSARRTLRAMSFGRRIWKASQCSLSRRCGRKPG